MGSLGQNQLNSVFDLTASIQICLTGGTDQIALTAKHNIIFSVSVQTHTNLYILTTLPKYKNETITSAQECYSFYGSIKIILHYPQYQRHQTDSVINNAIASEDPSPSVIKLTPRPYSK